MEQYPLSCYIGKTVDIIHVGAAIFGVTAPFVPWRAIFGLSAESYTWFLLGMAIVFLVVELQWEVVPGPKSDRCVVNELSKMLEKPCEGTPMGFGNGPFGLFNSSVSSPKDEALVVELSPPIALGMASVFAIRAGMVALWDI